jgi:hypothetical protein
MRKKRQKISNPAVERVRRARELLAKDYDYDIDAYCRALMAVQAKSNRRYRTPRKRAPRP